MSCNITQRAKFHFVVYFTYRNITVLIKNELHFCVSTESLSRLLSLCGTRVSAEHLQIKKNAKYHHSKASLPIVPLTPQSVTTVLQADQTDKARIVSQWTWRAPLPCWEGVGEQPLNRTQCRKRHHDGHPGGGA